MKSYLKRIKFCKFFLQRTLLFKLTKIFVLSFINSKIGARGLNMRVKKAKKSHKGLKICFSVLGVSVLALGGTLLGLFSYSWNYKIPEQENKIEENKQGLVQAKNRSLYDPSLEYSTTFL